MTETYVCNYVGTLVGRFGDSLSSVRTDDLGAIPVRALMARNSAVDGGPWTNICG